MEKEKLIELLRPTLIEVEEFRKRQLRLKKMEYGFYGLGTVLSLSIFVSWTMSMLMLAGILVVLFIILLILRFTMVGTPKEEYQKKYEQQVIKGIVRTLNPAIKYSSNSHKYKTSIQNSGLLRGANFSDKEGIVLDGKTKNAYPFQLIKGGLMTPLPSQTSKGNSTSFEGLICILEGEHYLGEHTIIKPKEGWMESSMSMLTQEGKTEDFILFSTKHKLASFNEKYTIYTKKRNEVETLLSTEALQKIETLAAIEKAPMTMVLKGNKLFLLFSGVDYFEAHIEQSLLGTNAVPKTYDELLASLHLVEELSALIGGETNKMKIITKEIIKPIDNARNSAYDHFIDDEL